MTQVAPISCGCTPTEPAQPLAGNRARQRVSGARRALNTCGGGLGLQALGRRLMDGQRPLAPIPEAAIGSREPQPMVVT